MVGVQASKELVAWIHQSKAPVDEATGVLAGLSSADSSLLKSKRHLKH